jgi:hypothetical protein
MKTLEKNDFSKDALQNLVAEINLAFASWSDIEIIKHVFSESDDGSIFSETHLYANDHLHQITLEFYKPNNSWIYRANCIRNLGEKRLL